MVKNQNTNNMKKLIPVLLFFSFSCFSQVEKIEPQISIFTEWNYTVYKPVNNSLLFGTPDLRLGFMYHAETNMLVGLSHGILNNDYSMYIGYKFKVPKFFKRKKK